MGYWEGLVIWALVSILLAPIAGMLLHGVPERKPVIRESKPRRSRIVTGEINLEKPDEQTLQRCSCLLESGAFVSKRARGQNRR